MKPKLAAEKLRRNIAQYPTTTFAIDDDATREELTAFFISCRLKVVVAAGSPTNPSTWPPA
ncbi:hypothetical protein [Amycolatopsis sp. NPDC004625]|uniref:hypothetical protein n=1 Tax=Amycolatopsis sp. NPDC004625 TaxID=3154670 RepID=UPI0033BDCE6A